MKEKFLQFALGVITGAALFGGASAAAAGLVAQPAWSPIYVDGQQVQMTAYNILGNNYVKLRDIGKAVGFNVYFQDGVQVDSKSPYTGEAPAKAGPQPAQAESTFAEIDLSANMEIRQEMVRLINEERRANGVAELPVNEALMKAAQDCAAHKMRKHSLYEWQVLHDYGWPYGGNFNLTCFMSGADGTYAARTAVYNWVHSPGHFDTLVREEATCLGTGVCLSGGMAYCYMVVGDPNGISPL